MKSRYKFVDGDGFYFLTFTVIKKIPIFTNKKYFDTIISNFEFYRNQYGLKIFYYVIMDNHIHLICKSDKEISQSIRKMKSYLSKEFISLLKKDSRSWILDLLKFYKKEHKKNSKYQLWDEGSHPEKIVNLKMLNQKANYIHFNPVKRGFVNEPKDWFYSSARNIESLENPFQVDEIEV